MHKILITENFWYPGCDCEGKVMGHLGPSDRRMVNDEIAAELIEDGKAVSLGEFSFDVVRYADDGWMRHDIGGLKGMFAGKPIHVLGCGESVKDFKPDGNPVIACNAAGNLGYSDVNVVVEGECALTPWFRDIVGRDCITVFDRLIAHFLTGDVFAAADESWWRNVIWDKRRGNHADLASLVDGLIYHQPTMRGTVVLSAYGLALGLGASAVHFWGTELSWKSKGDQQHFYGDSPYKETRIKGIYTSEYFYQSAEAIAEIILAHPEVDVVDHSAGLISKVLDEMRDAQAVAQAEYDARSKE